MKRTIAGFILGMIFASAVAYSAVQIQNLTSKQYRLDLVPGQRIIVMSKDSRVNLRVYEGTKEMDCTVPAGKIIAGVLFEK